jgi:hypothetical protein
LCKVCKSVESVRSVIALKPWLFSLRFCPPHNLTQTIIACYKNLPQIVETDEDDNEAFRNAMDLLDQIEDFKRES